MSSPNGIYVIVHHEEGVGYWAEVPAYPGCMTQGRTIDELKNNVIEALEGWKEAANAMARAQLKKTRTTVLEDRAPRGMLVSC